MSEENKNNNWNWWNPEKELQEVSSKEIIYSKGFIQSDISKLFPSFPSFWDSFLDKFSFDVDFVDIKQTLQIPENLDYVYKGTIDKEDIFVCFNEESFGYLGNMIIPSANEKVMEIVMEYLSQRLLSSLSYSWTANDNSVIYFDGKYEGDVHGEASVVISLKVSGTKVNVYVVVPYSIVNMIDKLWRGQIQTTSKYKDIPDVNLELEIAELAISPSMINSYLGTNVRVGLEKMVNNNVIIKKDNERFLSGKLLRSGNRLVVEILGGAEPQGTLPQGTVSISIQLGSVIVPGYVISEITQRNALWNTGLALSNEVNVIVDNKPSKKALLASYDKQFAIEVK